MSWGFAILFVAGCALVAFSTSAFAGLALVPAERALARTEAQGRARLLLVLTLLPAFASLLVLVAAFGPWLGLAVDHCLGDPHAHAHLCFAHPAPSASPLLVLPAAALAARLVAGILRAGANVSRSHTVLRELRAASIARIGDAHVLPVQTPQAFVLGLVTPRLFVTRGLLASSPDDVRTVVAHERAHAARRDPLRRLVASVALSFHLPGIAGALERRLGLAHEMAADAEAAGEVGGALQVAESLVAVARSSERGGVQVSERVLELLCETPRHPGPRLPAIAIALGVFVVAITVGADLVHHYLEHALGLLGA